jgi:dTDP-4-dehydrorhamnose reductase
VRVLVAGAAGQVGSEVAPLLPHHEVLELGSADLDVADRDRVEQVVGEFGPDLVVNCAAFTDVDGAESREDRAFAVNALGVRNLAVATARAGAHLVHVSTDYVFDGTKADGYHEWDPVSPMSAYGRTKRAGEVELERHATSWTLVRTSWVFGRRGRNFVDTIVGRAESGQPLRVVDDQRGCPTYAPDLAEALVRLGVGRRQGVFHVTNAGACSWFDLARAAVAGAGLDPEVVAPMASSELDRPAPRPTNSVLDNAALRLAGDPPLRPWPDALATRLAERSRPTPEPA